MNDIWGSITRMLILVSNLKKIGFNRFFKVNTSFCRCLCDKKKYKLLFFGSDGIALSSLRRVNEFRNKTSTINKLDLVITKNSKNKSEIEKYAQDENITTRLWPLQDLQPEEYDLGLIVAFGHLINDNVLNKFPLGMINVHPSLLPRWRGAAPIIYTLMHGDDVTGVTLMKIKANVFDVGEIISQRKVDVSKDIKQPDLTEQLSNIGADMLVECLRNLPQSIAHGQPQQNEGVTYARKICKAISEVKWSDMTAMQVYNLHRALYGIYSLSTTYKGSKMKLFEAFIDNHNQSNKQDTPGTFEYCSTTNSLKVLCRDNRFVNFKSLRLIGKREITALDFYNGYIKNIPEEKRKCIAFKC